MAQMEFIEAAKSGDLVRMRQLELCIDSHSSVRVDVNFQCPPDGSTALFWAACCGHVMTCDWLIRHGARVILANIKTGSLPLHGAADRGHSDCVRLLIRSGRNLINQGTTSNGDTPLHLAAYRGHLDVCRLLVRHGACTDAVNKQGRTALDEARIMNHYDVFQLLCKHYQDTSLTKTLPEVFSNTCEMFDFNRQKVAEENDENGQKMLTVPVYLPSSYDFQSIKSSNTLEDKLKNALSHLTECPNSRLRFPSTNMLSAPNTNNQRETKEVTSLGLYDDVIQTNHLTTITSQINARQHDSNMSNFNDSFVPQCPKLTFQTLEIQKQASTDACSCDCQPKIDCCRQYDATIRKLCGKLADLEAYVDQLQLEQIVRDERVVELERLNKALTT